MSEVYQMFHKSTNGFSASELKSLRAVVQNDGINALSKYKTSTVSLSFTGPWNGSIAANATFVRIGDIVHMFLSGTSTTAASGSAVAESITIPTSFQPVSSTNTFPCVIIDNDLYKIGMVNIWQGTIVIGNAGGNTASTPVNSYTVCTSKCGWSDINVSWQMGEA